MKDSETSLIETLIIKEDPEEEPGPDLTRIQSESLTTSKKEL